MEAIKLLTAWEQGLAFSLPRRALALVRAAYPQLSADDAAALSLGERDDLLLQLRERLFGAQLDFVDTCPACGERLESQLRVRDLRSEATQINPFCEAEVGGRHITFRPPAAGDVLDLPDDADKACKALLARCMSWSQIVSTSDIDALSERELESISAAMAAADPRASNTLTMHCVLCSHEWQSEFDIAAFLWVEIEAWALRTLRDVHVLARAYAWNENEILALSPARRQMYLDLCAS